MEIPDNISDRTNFSERTLFNTQLNSGLDRKLTLKIIQPNQSISSYLTSTGALAVGSTIGLSLGTIFRKDLIKMASKEVINKMAAVVVAAIFLLILSKVFGNSDSRPTLLRFTPDTKRR